MGSSWRSACAAALATEADLLWRNLSPLTSMAGTLGRTTNSSLRKLRRARVGDFRPFEASNAARRGAKRAVRAVAHALLVIALHMLNRKENYRELGAGHFDRLDVNRIRRSLVRRLGHRVTLTKAFRPDRLRGDFLRRNKKLACPPNFSPPTFVSTCGMPTGFLWHPHRTVLSFCGHNTGVLGAHYDA